MWLSTRAIRRRGDPEWDGYIHSVGLAHWLEVRTIDSWCNKIIDLDRRGFGRERTTATAGALPDRSAALHGGPIDPGKVWIRNENVGQWNPVRAFRIGRVLDPMEPQCGTADRQFGHQPNSKLGFACAEGRKSRGPGGDPVKVSVVNRESECAKFGS